MSDQPGRPVEDSVRRLPPETDLAPERPYSVSQVHPQSLLAPGQMIVSREDLQRLAGESFVQAAVGYPQQALLFWRLKVGIRTFLGSLLALGLVLLVGMFLLTLWPLGTIMVLAPLVAVAPSALLGYLYGSRAYMTLEYQRAIVFRDGKFFGEKGGQYRVRPFSDEVRNFTDLREKPIPVRFNKIAMRDSTGQGAVIASPELLLWATPIEGKSHLMVLKQQDVGAALVGEAEGQVRKVFQRFKIDDFLRGNEVLLLELQEVVNPYLEKWGVRVRVETTDTGISPELEAAYGKGEMAEVEGEAIKKLAEAHRQAQETLASASTLMLSEWAAAIKKVFKDLGQEVTKEDILAIIKESYNLEVARALGQGGEGGVRPFVDISALTGFGRTRED